MKILLIKPPLNRYLFSPAVGEPLELEYLASAVNEHDVEILDMRIDKNLVGKLEKFDPHFVGITGYTCDVNSSKDVLKEVKKFNRNIITAIGGVHASALPGEAIEHADSVVIGEAEYIWPKLLEDFKDGSLKKFYKADGLVDLTNLPIPKRELLNKKIYISTNVVQATPNTLMNPLEKYSSQKI